LEQAATKLLLDGQRFELDLLLSGPYDHADARLVLTAGAGGTEANDWVADLKRMYERHCQYMKVFTCTVQDEQAGDVVGYKSVELLISGPNAYGWLQGEKGAHRLVRQSPYNANNKRQTTFAGVDVAPDILREEDLKDVYVPETDLEITTMRSGGKGGQNVNKVNSAVRIKHIPSGIQVKCSQERSQPLNKDIALQRLKAQLLAIAQEERLDEIAQVRGDIVQASWGRQIRNYVLHPYKMIKDARTGWETSNAAAFLDGGELLEQCIGAHLRHKAEQQAKRQEEKEATSSSSS
jgi:peptide chain release factor 2